MIRDKGTVNLQNDCDTVTNTGHPGFGDSSGTVEVSSPSMYGVPYIVQTIPFPDRIEILWRRDPQCSYTFLGAKPEPMVWKVIYKAKGDRIVTREIYGKYIPSYTVPESYEFDEE